VSNQNGRISIPAVGSKTQAAGGFGHAGGAKHASLPDETRKATRWSQCCKNDFEDEEENEDDLKVAEREGFEPRNRTSFTEPMSPE